MPPPKAATWKPVPPPKPKPYSQGNGNYNNSPSVPETPSSGHTATPPHPQFKPNTPMRAPNLGESIITLNHQKTSSSSSKDRSNYHHQQMSYHYQERTSNGHAHHGNHAHGGGEMYPPPQNHNNFSSNQFYYNIPQLLNENNGNHGANNMNNVNNGMIPGRSGYATGNKKVIDLANRGPNRESAFELYKKPNPM